MQHYGLATKSVASKRELRAQTEEGPDSGQEETEKHPDNHRGALPILPPPLPTAL
tara:strand:- start:7883 stop:8047 length:165 start_codon:yes stop_codon:yes gene_type:complete